MYKPPEFDFNDDLRAELKGRISRLQRHSLSSDDLRHAAVAIVLIAEARSNETCFVLTRRSASLRRHRGQYALPGGRIDSDEAVQDAALREIEEEIGIRLDAGAILGWLDDFATRSGFCITPIVIWARQCHHIRPDPSEVEAVFKVPLWDLNRPEIPHLETVRGSDHPVLSAPLQTLGHEIYAPTAAILYQFRELALHGRSTRVAHFEQPQFAWS